MNNKYKRLSFFEREEISRGLASGWKISVIARYLNRPISTISREIKKNCEYKLCYRAERADQRALDIRHRNKQPPMLEVNGPLMDYVLGHLRKKWSPEEIARRLAKDYPEDKTMHVSHETIYSYIYCLPRRNLKKELLKCLRQERKFRHKRKSAHAKRSTISDFLSISERPEEVKTA